MLLFHVPVRGSAGVLLLGTVLYVTAATGFGLLISTFVKTQVAAVFAAGILTSIPAISFSGMLSPASSLSGVGKILGLGFPSIYFQQIGLGTFTKALGLAELRSTLFKLVVVAVAYLLASTLLLNRQER